MKEAIKKAIQGGFKPHWSLHEDTIEKTIEMLEGKDEIYSDYFGTIKQAPKPLLDPLFWQSLGKALNWKIDKSRVGLHEWKIRWHEFTEHLINGGEAEKFFNQLLK